MRKWRNLLTAVVMAVTLCVPAVAQETPSAVTDEAALAAETSASSEAVEETPVSEQAYEEEEVFAQWNQDAPALQTLISYVEAVTDESSEDYIPPSDRIATFDMDGTIYAELFPTYLEYYAFAWRVLKDPTIQPDAEMLAVARTIRDCALDKSYPEDMPVQHAVQAARAYSGMTLNEFSDFVTQILLRDADGFEGMTYGEAFYVPILEVIEYLQDNDFNVYVVSGSDRFLCRTLFEGVADIPYENFIGMDDEVEATGQGDTDGLDYVFTANDDVIRTDKMLIKNLKMNKVCQIVRDIGHQPVLSFGNTSGDVSMHMYTISNNKYKSAAFMLIADDEERDYGNTAKAQDLRAQWEASGFNVISMKDDFKTIYGEGVVKTGSFHWTDELADDRGEGAAVFTSDALERVKQANEAQAAQDAAADAAADQNQAPAEAAQEDNSQEQYVMYLGTNSKDTNAPMFEKDECKERAKKILMDMTGGYTIQEADGGWIDDNGNECQEYTLVIYLSDITTEKVHEIADVFLKEFNQNSILIQTNPTQTEFYSGN